MSAPPGDGEAAVTVAVVVCTYRRPAVLARLLRRLVDVAAAADGRATVGVVVVDDDPDTSARDTVASMSDAFELGVEYVSTASGNISTARNAAVDAGTTMAQLVAMTDDDCLPDVDWLVELLEVRDRTGAPSVCGACVDVAPPGAPRWLTEQPFLSPMTSDTDGAVTSAGHVKNLLVDPRLVAEHGIRFDERLGRIGGEDALYLTSLERAGIERRFAAGAVVREQLPDDRATLRYQLRRSYWYGNTEAVTSLEDGTSTRARLFLGGIKAVVLAVLRPVRQLVGRRRPELAFACSEVVRGVGRSLGGLGVAVDHH
jgi:succinoglycan biosynthesis protein ExoM